MHSFRTAITLLLISALVITLPIVAQEKQKAPNPAVADIVNANSQFALALYKNINAAGSSKGKNIFVSPYSISTALAMTYTGARGNTKTELSKVLFFDAFSEEKLNTGFSSLLQQTKATPGKHYKLDVANALWGQKDYHFEPSFTSTVSKYYDGGFNTVDFVGANEATRKQINTWVEKKTNEKIKDLIHQGDINELTRLVLTNAIYFKGDWASKFKKENTKPAPFTVAPGKTVDVPLMAQTETFPFMQNDEVKVIELPYAGDDLSFIAILPAGDIEKFGAELTVAKLQELRKQLHPTEVHLFLPRYKFETRYLLAENLIAMGMPDAFSEMKADFSGMTGAPKLYISRVIHQAMIDVNEEGSEAAAATAVVMTTKAMRMPPTFRADKPFIFMIIHKPTDSILFMGRVSEPPAATGK